MAFIVVSFHCTTSFAAAWGTKETPIRHNARAAIGPALPNPNARRGFTIGVTSFGRLSLLLIEILGRVSPLSRSSLIALARGMPSTGAPDFRVDARAS